MAKWFTCAPRRFEASSTFFLRDSGLICRMLQKMGHDSKVVLAGPAFPGDTEEVIRGNPNDLASSEWWRNLGIDGVIMVAWGLRKDTPIVRAIAKSGTKIILHIDGSNQHFPFFKRRETLHTFWRQEHDMPYGVIRKVIGVSYRVLKSSVFSMLDQGYCKYQHLRHLSLLSCQTPTSMEGLRSLCELFGGAHHTVNIALSGYPSSITRRWDGSVPKEKRIIAIGRWNDLRQKRPYVLMSVCEAIARKHSDLFIDIFGTTIPDLISWHDGLESSIRERITVHGVQPGEKVFAALMRSQASFFPSSNEGGPQAMFEGLASGTPTVFFDSPSLPGGQWAFQVGHGELAEHDNTESYVAALERVLSKWESGGYDPKQISEYWEPWTRCDLVIERMLSAVNGTSAAESYDQKAVQAD